MFRFSIRKMATFVGAILLYLCAQTTLIATNSSKPGTLHVCWSLGKDIDETRAHWGLDIAKAEGVSQLRLYDSAPTPSRFLHIAKERGMRVTMGAWLGTNQEENAEQLLLLRNAITAGLVEPTAVIGNEALLFKSVNLEQLIEHIEETKRNLPKHVAVTTAEIFHVLIKNPRLIDAQQHAVGLIYYPFANAVHIDHALQDLVNHYEQIKALSGNKRVVVYETGWPSDGNPVGHAVPSVENQKKYNQQVSAWALKHNIEVYLFQIIDESWKARFGNPYEAHWGLRREDGSPKH